MLTPFVALMRKDLRLFFSDRRAVILTMVVPIAIASFFGYIFGGGAGDRETSRIAILAVDQDGSTISRDLVSRMAADRTLDVKPSDLDAAKETVRKGKATVAFLIPKDFGATAARVFFGPGKKPEIALFYDPSHSMEMSMVQGMLAGHSMEAVSKEVFTGATGRDVVRDALNNLDRTGLAAEDKARLRDLLRGVEGWNTAMDQRKDGR